MMLLNQILTRMLEIWKNKEIGVRTDETGAPICYYCGSPVKPHHTHKDHIFPRAEGGGNYLYNFVLSCEHCNLSKQAKHPLEWIADQDIPDDLAVDYIARLLLGVYFSYRRQPARLSEAIPEWRTYQAEKFDPRYFGLIVEKTYDLHLPAYPLGEDVEINSPCPECGCTGRKAELPGALALLLRCSICGDVEPVHARPPDKP